MAAELKVNPVSPSLDHDFKSYVKLRQDVKKD